MDNEKLSAEIETLVSKLKETDFPSPLQSYIVSLAMNIEKQVDTLASFVPFNIELHIY